MTSVAAPPGRYGPERTSTGRRWRLAALVACAVVALGAVSWLGLHHSEPTVSFQNYGYSNVTAESVDVTFDVTVAQGTAVVCTIDASNALHAQVGTLDASLPASDQDTTRYTVTVRTTEKPVNGVVDSCRTAS
ncbi:DUF4307 domain-containing protein [Luteimicrobium subarcticum]|uniref:Uncharacterized protein DUF4307 n=1 Tax=Luteimicrobium subarcticum TaxID=620910 RepID=A0A2M8WT97_9MICO|nr:DUF4307 domain-containing protein [Luteimicrobium subarcticum]PJI94172.1 uncharacterized protein DUF4307 [Luteimicrobium subarcticum]